MPPPELSLRHRDINTAGISLPASPRLLHTTTDGDLVCLKGGGKGGKVMRHATRREVA